LRSQIGKITTSYSINPTAPLPWTEVRG
jgi:hypothetical protein